MARKSPEVGTFFKIPLEINKNAYARLINAGLFSFYKIDEEGRTNEEIMQLLSSAFSIFSIYVHKDVFSKSNWQVLGYKPLEEHILNNMPVFFRQDIVDKTKCWIVSTVPGYKKAVTPQECINLEISAVWDFQTVEERLRDYFENKPNKWVEFYKVKL